MLLAYRWKIGRRGWLLERLFWWGVFLVVLGVYLLSTPIGARLMLALTAIDDSERDEPSKYIVVLSGGYLAADRDPGHDVLGQLTALRVATGTSWAKEHPETRLVMTGAGERPDRESSRMAELMRDYAVGRGIPEDRIILETDSRNTSEHPISLLEKNLIEPGAPIGIVTSNWHLRRAKREFQRHFDSVQWRGASENVHIPNAYQWFLPHEDSVTASTAYIRERVGLVWYERNAANAK